MYLQFTPCGKVNDKITNAFKSLVGVRPCDVLSPNLFRLFINDLPTYLSSSLDPIYLKTKRLDCLLQPDGVISLSSSAAGLQAKIDLLQAFCED